MKYKKYILIVVMVLILLWKYSIINVNATGLLVGEGTIDNPYKISTVNDLLVFKEKVDAGDTFSGKYVEQTTNIDLSACDDWDAIGGTDKSTFFDGVYNGKGHYIENIKINKPEKDVAFLGWLSGTVINLGIESGSIEGNCAAGIAVHANGNSARIINCYNKATIIGNRAGGIADDFDGQIINCWNTGDCVLKDGATGYGLTSYSVEQIIYGYSIQEPYDVKRFKGEAYFEEKLDKNVVLDENFADKLNKNLEQCIKFKILNYNDVVFWQYQDDSCHFEIEDLYNIDYRGKTEYQPKETGAKNAPINICSQDDLIMLSAGVNYGNTYEDIYFKQRRDINFDEKYNWQPIGNVEKGKVFAGKFDGNGYLISNINSSQNMYTGLFGYLAGEIYNVQLTNINFTGQYVGGIACVGYASPDIYNCSVSGTMTGTHSASGIVGDLGDGRIFNCWSLLNESQNNYGICANGGKIVKDCFSNIVLYKNLANKKIDNFQGTIPYMMSSQFASDMNQKLMTNRYVPVENVILWTSTKENQIIQKRSNNIFKIPLWIKYHIDICVTIFIAASICIYFSSINERNKRYNSRRNGLIDFLRILFCINIMLLHWGEWLGDSALFSPSGYIGVAFFYMVTGHFLAKEIHSKSSNVTRNELANETLTFFWKKLKSILPYYIIAVAISFIVVSIDQFQSWTIIWENFKLFISEILMLQMIGLPTYTIIATEWYLSALFITLPIIYIFVRRYGNIYTICIGPLVSLLVLGWILHQYGCLTLPGTWTGICYEGVLRAFALLTLGATSYSISIVFKNKFPEHSKVLSIIEILLWLTIFAEMFLEKGYTSYDFILVMMIFIALCITLSGRTITSKLQNNTVCNMAAKMSIPLFLCHGFLLNTLPKYVKEWDKWYALGSFLILAIIASIIDILGADIISGRLKKNR